MVTSITSGRLVVFKKTVWVGMKPKHEKILHDVTVVVVLDDVFDPLVAVQTMSTLRALADFNITCYVMNNEEKAFSIKTNFVFINEENTKWGFWCKPATCMNHS